MEIERKFLVDRSKWNLVEKNTVYQITQAYIEKNENLTIRVRLKNTKAYLTIKGKTTGISRSEFEYEIPFNDALELINKFASKTITKERFEIFHGKHLWEIDVFHGHLEGLIIAEIELNSENEEFEKPDWILGEVSYDQKYFNANLLDIVSIKDLQ